MAQSAGLAALPALAVAIVVVLHGCGGGSEETTAASPTPAPPAPTPPVCGGTSGTDYCCPMPGSSSPCAETACNRIAEVEAGKLWTVVTEVNPRPPGFVGPPHNRMAIMLLDAGVGNHPDKSLALVNGVKLDEELKAELKALEKAQSATVRYLLSTGDWHFVFMGDYVEPFPEATIFIPPGRIPDEKSDEVDFNYTLYDIAEPLKELRPALHIQNMDGLIQPQMVPSYDENSSRNELFFFHQSSKTLMAGDLFWLYTCEPSASTKATWPGATKGSVRVWNAQGTSIWSRKPEEVTRAKVSAQALLDLDFSRYIGIHGNIGNILAPDSDPSAKALFEGALKGEYGILPSGAQLEV